MTIPEVVKPNVVIYTFEATNNIRRGCRWSVDVNQLRDPYGQTDLRALDGRNAKVLGWIASDPRIAAITQAVGIVVQDQLFAPGATDKHLSLGLYDRRGTHIAPAVGRLVGDGLRKLFPSLPILLVHQAIRHNNHPTVDRIEA